MINNLELMTYIRTTNETTGLLNMVKIYDIDNTQGNISQKFQFIEEFIPNLRYLTDIIYAPYYEYTELILTSNTQITPITSLNTLVVSK